MSLVSGQCQWSVDTQKLFVLLILCMAVPKIQFIYVEKVKKTTANHNFSNFQAFCDISVNIGFLRQVETIR